MSVITLKDGLQKSKKRRSIIELLLRHLYWYGKTNNPHSCGNKVVGKLVVYLYLISKFWESIAFKLIVILTLLIVN